MSKKATIAAPKTETTDLAVNAKPELVRVEESIESFITLMLASVPGTKLQICSLWTDGSGKAYFRCKFWKLFADGLFTTRKEMKSHFICVETYNGKRTITDSTR